jgi:diaminopropionate ammonia-lyase
MTARRSFINPGARDASTSGLFDAADYAFVSRFYTGRSAFAPTPLHRLTGLAASLGLADIFVKDESNRFGLPAFKIVGVELALSKLEAAERLPPGTVVACATAGNHGRAVAHAATGRGLRSVVYVPAGTRPDKIAAIAREGASVVLFDGGYDDAVREVTSQASAHGWQIVSDTSWPGYEEIPRWIMLGYTRIFDEASAAWPNEPDAVIVQAGVGGLAAAAAAWWVDKRGAGRARLVCAEPEAAAGLLESARLGRRSVLASPFATIMECLGCLEPSPAAWPVIAAAMDAFVAVSDDEARSAMERLANPLESDWRIESGPSGACGLAALCALMTDEALLDTRQALGLGARSTVMVIVSEGTR